VIALLTASRRDTGWVTELQSGIYTADSSVSPLEAYMQLMTDYDAVLFDMDGVTVETAARWRELEEEEILPAAVVGEPPIEEVRALSVSDSYDRLDALDGVELTVSAAEYDALYDDNATAVYQHTELMDGYLDLLGTLDSRGYSIGLVSASRRGWVEMVLDRFDLHDRYDVVVSSSDIEGPSKPDPTPYLAAAESLEVDPARCLVVEDSRHGIEAAVEAGMDCFALRGMGNENSDLSTADRVLDSSAELRSALVE
jgi:HAD superfamily hydrolase (TIGR01509 family)